MHDQGDRRVLGGVERREQIELLKNETDGLTAEAAERPATQCLEVRAKNSDVSLVGPKHRGQYGDQRRLPATRRSHKQGHFAGAGLEVRVIEHDLARFSTAEALAQSPGEDGGQVLNP